MAGGVLGAWRFCGGFMRVRALRHRVAEAGTRQSDGLAHLAVVNCDVSSAAATPFSWSPILPPSAEVASDLHANTFARFR